MPTQNPIAFREPDQLSAWTEKLADAIRYPAMQFDTRGRNWQRDKSRLYYNLLPHGYLCLDVYAHNVSNVSGCVVFVVGTDMDDYPVVTVQGQDDFSLVIKAFMDSAESLPNGQRLAESGESTPERRDGLEERQLIELGRCIHEARTGNPFPKKPAPARSRPSALPVESASPSP